MQKKIFVEGPTDKSFLELYLKYLNINNYQIESIDGKDNILNYPNIKKHQNSLIIFDADDDYNQSIANIKLQLKNLGVNNNNIFLFPNNNDIGNLETLIKNIAKHKQILDCFDSFETCVETLNILGTMKQPKKSKVFAYMAAFGFKKNKNNNENFDLSPYVDFNSNYIKPLKKFLKINSNNP